MSIIFRNPNRSIHVHSQEAEIVDSTSAKVKLLVDSNATGGALSTVQVTLTRMPMALVRFTMIIRLKCFTFSTVRCRCFRAPTSSRPNAGT